MGETWKPDIRIGASTDTQTEYWTQIYETSRSKSYDAGMSFLGKVLVEEAEKEVSELKILPKSEIRNSGHRDTQRDIWSGRGTHSMSEIQSSLVADIGTDTQTDICTSRHTDRHPGIRTFILLGHTDR